MPTGVRAWCKRSFGCFDLSIHVFDSYSWFRLHVVVLSLSLRLYQFLPSNLNFGRSCNEKVSFACCLLLPCLLACLLRYLKSTRLAFLNGARDDDTGSNAKYLQQHKDRVKELRCFPPSTLHSSCREKSN
jgi:hypothetical protein